MNADLIYYAEERRLMDLIDTRDAIADQSSYLWREANSAIECYLDKLPMGSRVDRLCQALAFLDTQDRIAKTEIARLHDWQSKARNTAASLKARAQAFLVDTQRTRIDGYTSALRLTPNPPKVVIHDEALVPNEYKEITVNLHYSNWLLIVDHVPTLAATFRSITKPEPIKSLIKIALDSGEGVPGCAIEQEFRVDVR